MVDVLVGKEEELIVDERTGLVQKVETVTVAARDEYGNVVMKQQRRAVGVRILPQSIQSAPTRRALTSSVDDAPRTYYRRREDWAGMKLFKMCILPFFIPCVYNRLVMAAIQVLVFLCVLVGIVFIGIGPLHTCSADDFYIYASVGILVIFILILCLSGVCCCFTCHTESGAIMEIKRPGEDGRSCQVCWMFLAWLIAMIFLALVILETAFVFSNKDKVYPPKNVTNPFPFDTTTTPMPATVPNGCKFEQSLVGGLSFSYILIVFFSSYWCCVFKEVYDNW